MHKTTRDPSVKLKQMYWRSKIHDNESIDNAIYVSIIYKYQYDQFFFNSALLSLSVT